MSRRDRLNAMRDLFREIFTVRHDGRVVYQCGYTVRWRCVSGDREVYHPAGETFGTTRASGGHWQAGFHGLQGVKEHEVSWLLVNDKLPEGRLTIDHVNGLVDDNNHSNLRAVTKSVNQHNQRRAKGYSWSKKTSKWQARIHLAGVLISLGLFDTELDARAAYIRAKREYHPECGWDIFN